MYARLTEVRDCAHDELYWQGAQYIWWSNTDRCIYSATDAPGVQGYGQNLQDMPRFEFVTNIYQSKGLGAMAAITGAVPTIRFFPETEDSADIETAREYDKLSEIIDHWNPPKQLLQDESYYLWCNGVVGLFTDYVENGEKFGVQSREVLNQGQTDEEDEVRCPKCGFTGSAEHFHPPVPCPQCGNELTADNIAHIDSVPIPEEGGTEESENGGQIIEAVGALELHRPQWARSQEQYTFLIREREVHYAQLREKFPDKADKIKAGAGLGAGDEYERSVRLCVAEGTKKRTQSSEALSVLTTDTHVWFRPALFWTQEKSIRERLIEIFPRGCKVQFGGDTYLTSKAQSMDDCWRVEHAYPGAGQHRPGIGSAMVSVQDRFNTFSNICAETYEYGIPITYRSADTFDQEANADQRSEPGQEVPVIVRDGQDIRTKILQVRSDSVSPDMYRHMMDLAGPISQEMSGVLPAVVGETGEGAAAQTATGYAMQRDQGMGRLGIPYSRLRQATADIKTLACRMYRKNASGTIKVMVKDKSGEFSPLSADIDSIRGEARAFPEGDEAFPQSWGQKRSTVMQLMDTPYGAPMMKEPENAELFTRLIGVPELEIPGARNVRKALADISELTEVLNGEDFSQQLTIEPDPVVDDISIEVAVARRYLQEETGRKLRRENPPGYENVRNYLATRDATLKQQAQAQPQPMEPIRSTISLAVDKQPPTVQAQILGKEGIQVTPQDYAENAVLSAVSKGKAAIGNTGAPAGLPPGVGTGGMNG